MIVITNNGEALNSPVGFDPDPRKDEAAPLEGAASGIEGNQPMKAFDAKIVPQRQPGDKEFSTTQAQFARRGHELKAKRHPAGLTLFEVTRHGQTRVFSHFGDVGAFLTQLQQGGQHG